uniref:CUE domain-containing protein n=1 Tax=Pyramimonas obovata TaxID=1411642 RepID=A0A7S0WHT4_9CHLO|mmetsp:Transcript_25943/g.56285  ORF Transcript_25943/g.56285 Transcript_25943/m.56285 type:complete len:185 (+) Transcript_25943:141-695(+)|eukprot:CAMPEP_0118928460 /NCGR_PEP_ID=MMETSP1169-20130426/5704_1 /TAXON_ID=36882 /ORGANISM="Pyramimonas obovata, Strain CCMP722" /LENGTH=184 /DNA_ID=CAMNT_0006870435 /DNA_START=132 /DNA_END=686 /DNA_ORIENTATION=-
MEAQQVHVTCPKCDKVSSAHTDSVVACPFCEQHMRTPASAPPVATPVKANPETVKEIKTVLSHLSDEQIEKALLANNNDKVAALKALLGGHNTTCHQQGYTQTPVCPNGQPHYYQGGQQYNVPNHPESYYRPQPQMAAAGGDRSRSGKEKGWWDENTEGMGFGSGLLIGGLGGVTTFLVGDAIF